MANRRMFSKSITHRAKFLSLPVGAQVLYFYLNLEADDDGYCEALGVLRIIKASEKLLDILEQNGFIRVFENHIIHITDWLISNKIQPSRYVESFYKDLYPLVNKTTTKFRQDDDKMITQDRIGKDSIGERKKAFSSINDIKEEQLQKLADDYSVPVKFVASKLEDLKLYCSSEGKRYKNYLSTLRAWVKKDSVGHKIQKPSVRSDNFKELSDTERKKNLAKMAELRKKVNH